MPIDLYAFRDRPLSSRELESLRLMLSTFRDGSGQVVLKSSGLSMPGFRDFERATASITGGFAREDKGIFDVWVPTSGLPFGISCKMAAAQPPANECSFMELSNSAAKFHSALQAAHVDLDRDPHTAGAMIVDLVMSWHVAVADEVDLAGSRYAVLAHDRRWEEFQVHCFPLDLKLADPDTEVEWLREGKSLNGYIAVGERRHRLWQWYAFSGGQLKYYPLLSWAEWSTPIFSLEEPPVISLEDRSREYFGEAWERLPDRGD